jgi:hypothetical protein
MPLQERGIARLLWWLPSGLDLSDLELMLQWSSKTYLALSRNEATKEVWSHNAWEVFMIQGVENKYSTSCPKLRGDVGDPRAVSTQRPTANPISATKPGPHAQTVANGLLVAIMAHGVENKYSTSCPKLRGDVGDPRADGSLSHKYGADEGTTSRLSTQRPTANPISATKPGPHAQTVANGLLVDTRCRE